MSVKGARKDLGQELTTCPKCKQTMTRVYGHYVCLHSQCLRPESATSRASDNIEQHSSSVDISKLTPQEVEARVLTSRYDEVAVKKAGFERYMDDITTAINHAANQADYDRFVSIRDNQAYPYYKKYHS